MSARTLRNHLPAAAALIGAVLTGLLALAAVAGPALAAAAEPAEALYKAKCNGCHGADGSGNTPMGKNLKVADLRSPAIQAKTDAQLGEAILAGKGKMTPYRGKLSQEQVTVLVAYVRTLVKPKA
ncbi:MAG TPA: cytochrome c [Thermoanaerobaculia bacterium]|nr:cytochrome c [Thermoanaerobaculia bacterium]